MMYEEKMKLRTEVTFIDDIVYGVEPCHYYDDGVRHIYKFIDEEGNLLVWKTSKSLGVDSFNDKGEEVFEFIDVGDKFFLRGSVKCLSTYKREDQVVLTRVTPEFIVEKDFMSEEEVKEFKRGLQLSKLKDVEIKTISYREYKGSYSIYETVADSFKRTDNGCFIDVIIPKHETSSLYYFSE